MRYRNRLTTKLLKSMIDGIEARGGKCDTIACGSDDLANQARACLQELGLDYHVIADDELSPSRIWVTSQEALSQFPGGGRN